MKNLILCLTLFALTCSASALLVTNGGFNEDAAEWGSAGGTGGGTASWGNSHETTGGNPGGYVTLREDPGNTWAWGVWYQIGTEKLNEWGIPVQTTVRMSADIKAETETSAVDHVYLKIESHSTGLLNAVEVQLPSVTTEWKTYSIDYTSVAGTTGLKCVLVAKDAASAAEIGYDNISLTIPGGTPALKPLPIVGGQLFAGIPVLSWINPDPNSPSGIITADVYILESDTLLSDPNLGPDSFDTGVVQVADDITAESLDLSSVLYTLTAGKYYYWAVHITDTEIGTVGGFDWHFLATDDAPPTVVADEDQYLVTTGSGMTLSLNATPQDDKPGYTVLWTDITNPEDKDPDTTVSFNNAAAVNPTVTLTNTASGVVTGFYQFEITVTDSVGQTASDQMTVGVYDTCAEAATADPDDNYDATGDLNGDCKKDLADLAILATDWLDCNTNRPEDVTCP